MKFYELELNGETIKFRLTSNDCVTIEKQSGKPFTEFMATMDMTTVLTLLRYMRRSSQHDFSMEDAGQLYDKLVDNGYALEDIISKVIMEALVVSGFMKKTDLETIKDVKEEMKEKLTRK